MTALKMERAEAPRDAAVIGPTERLGGMLDQLPNRELIGWQTLGEAADEVVLGAFRRAWLRDRHGLPPDLAAAVADALFQRGR